MMEGYVRTSLIAFHQFGILLEDALLRVGKINGTGAVGQSQHILQIKLELSHVFASAFQKTGFLLQFHTRELMNLGDEKQGIAEGSAHAEEIDHRLRWFLRHLHAVGVLSTDVAKGHEEKCENQQYSS